MAGKMRRCRECVDCGKNAEKMRKIVRWRERYRDVENVWIAGKMRKMRRWDGGEDAEDIRRIYRWRERCGRHGKCVDSGKDAEKMRRICGESVDGGKDADKMRKRCGKDAEKMRKRCGKDAGCGGWLDGGEKMRKRCEGWLDGGKDTLRARCGNCGDAANA